MKLSPHIETINKKYLMGLSCEMSLIENKTEALFSSFMPIRKQFVNKVNAPIYEVLLYDDAYFSNFNPNNTFTKWATIAMSYCNSKPESFIPLEIPSGLYAVFTFNGLVEQFYKYMEQIFTIWLPDSIYNLDRRPHFNILNDAFKKGDTHTEEVIYIPIQLKTNTLYSDNQR